MSNAIADRQALLDIYDALYRDQVPDVRSYLADYFSDGLSDDAELLAELDTQVVYTNWSYHLFAGHTAKINAITSQTNEVLRNLEIAELAFKSSKVVRYVGLAVSHKLSVDAADRIIRFHESLSDNPMFDYGLGELDDFYEEYDHSGFNGVHKKHLSYLAREKSKQWANLEALEAKKDNIPEEEYNRKKKLYNERIDVLDTERAESAQFTASFNTKIKAVASIANTAATLAQNGLAIARIVESSGDLRAEEVTSKALFMAGSVATVTSDVLEFLGHTKVSAAAAGAAGIAGLGASTANFALVAKLLDNPNLSDEHRKIVEAEVAIQATALALAAVEVGMGIALAALPAASAASTVLSAALPVVGALGSVAASINPLVWAEFDSKEERIDALRESDTYSSGMLADLLSESLHIEKVTYGSSTAMNATVGIGAGALAAVGAAPVGALVALIGGGLSAMMVAMQQGKLEKIADRYRETMMTDESGNPQSIDKFFAGSFEQQQDKARARHEKFFDEVLKGNTENIFSLGSQQLTDSDLSLAAITKTAGREGGPVYDQMGKQIEGSYLTSSAKHFFEQYRSDTRWNDQTIKLVQGQGNDRIVLPDANGEKSYLTFMSPLFASGTEERSRKETGKDSYETEIKIVDLAGWVIQDSGTNATTFDLDKVVTSAESLKGQRRSIDMIVDAGGGDDLFFGYESSIRKFDGGLGFDTASYAKLSGAELATGLNFEANGSNTVIVRKLIAEGSKYYQESIETKVENYGKRSEEIEYRAVSLTELDADILLTDNLMNIEVLQGSSLGDYFDVEKSTQVQMVLGFDGDDEILAGESIKMIAGGDGHDTIQLSTALLKKLLTTTDNKDAVLVDGGAGIDTLSLTSESFAYLQGVIERSKVLDQMVAEIAESMLPSNTPERDVELFKVSTALKSILSNSIGLSLNKLQFKEMENVGFELEDTANADYSSTSQRFYNLDDFYEVSNFIGSSVDDEGNVTSLGVAVSGADVGGAISVLGSQGSDAITGSQYFDVLVGNAGNDKLDGGRGNDILVGGEGADVYKIGLSGGHDVIAFENFAELDGDIVEVAKLNSADFYRYNSDLVLKVSDESSLTVLNYFDSVDISRIASRASALNPTVNYVEFDGHLSNYAKGTDPKDYPLMTGDVNGDGYDDLLGFGDSEVRVALGSAKGITKKIVYGHWDHGKNDDWVDWDGDLKTYDYPRFIGDVNGDGRDDIIGLGYEEVQVVLGQTDGSFGSIKESAGSLGRDDSFRSAIGRHVADVDGDGKLDIFGTQDDGDIVLAYGQSSGKLTQTHIRDHFDKNEMQDIFGELYPTSSVNYWKDVFDFSDKESSKLSNTFADVNGDGRADLVTFFGDRAMVSISSGNRDDMYSAYTVIDGDFGESYPSGYMRVLQHEEEALVGESAGIKAHNHHAGMGSTPRLFADVNGDGKDDLVTFASNGVYVALSKVPTWAGRIGGAYDSPFETPIFAHDDFDGNEGWGADYGYRYPRHVQDVNNDGRADLVGFGQHGIYLAFGQEDGTFSELKTEVPSGSFFNMPGSEADLAKTIGDFNGDGYADYAMRSADKVHIVYGQSGGLVANPEKTSSVDLTFKLGDTQVSTYSSDEAVHRAFHNTIGNDEFGSGYKSFRASGGDWAGLDLRVSEKRQFGGGLEAAISPLIRKGVATEGNDTITGSINDDIIDGLSGADIIKGHKGDDLIVSSDDVNALDGGDGQDIVSYENSSTNVRVDLRGSQNAVMKVGRKWKIADHLSNFEGAIGSRFADILHGSNGANILKGGDGKDTLIGEGGDDFIHGGEGKDKLNGGAGYDTLSYVGATNGVVIDLSGGQSAQYKNAKGRLKTLETISNFEAVVGSDHSDELWGSGAHNKLTGHSGEDYLVGRSGNDTLDGGSGNDSLYGEDHDDVLHGGGGDDLLYGQNGNDEIFGGMDQDKLVGGYGNDTLFGNDGDDSLYGEQGDDVIDAGEGNDLIVGGAGNDILILAGGQDTVHAEWGNDLIIAANANGQIFGGAGIDTLSFEESSTGIAINLASKQQFEIAKNGEHLLKGNVYDVENVNGTIFADYAVGSSANNTFELGRGDDTIFSGAGEDTIVISSDHYGRKVIGDFSSHDTLVISNFLEYRDFADVASAIKTAPGRAMELQLNNATTLELHSGSSLALQGYHIRADQFNFTGLGNGDYNFVNLTSGSAKGGSENSDVFVLAGDNFGNTVVYNFDPSKDIVQVNGFEEINDFFKIIERAVTQPNNGLKIAFDEKNSVTIYWAKNEPLTIDDLDGQNFAFRKMTDKDDNFVFANEHGAVLSGSHLDDVFVFKDQSFGHKTVQSFDVLNDVLMLADVDEFVKMSDVYDRHTIRSDGGIELRVDDENEILLYSADGSALTYDSFTADNFIFA